MVFELAFEKVETIFPVGCCGHKYCCSSDKSLLSLETFSNKKQKNCQRHSGIIQKIRIENELIEDIQYRGNFNNGVAKTDCRTLKDPLLMTFSVSLNSVFEFGNLESRSLNVSQSIAKLGGLGEKL